MEKFLFLLKFFQVLVSIFLIVTALVMIWELSNYHLIFLSSEQIHSWVSFGPKADLEKYIEDCQKSIAGLYNALWLVAKWVLCMGALNLVLVIVYYWIGIRTAREKKRDAKEPA